MLRTAAISITLLVMISALTARSQTCKPVALDTPTRWGGNIVIEADQRDHPVSNANGLVTIADKPQADILLQVYRRRDSDPLAGSSDHDKEPLPIAACVTGKAGTFRFNLPNGEYELRASTGHGMDVTHTYIVIRHGAPRSDRMVIRIVPGT